MKTLWINAFLKYWFKTNSPKTVRRKTRFAAVTMQALEDRIAPTVNVLFSLASTSGQVDIVVTAPNSQTSPATITLDEFVVNGGVISVDQNNTIQFTDNTNGLVTSANFSGNNTIFSFKINGSLNSVIVGGPDSNSMPPYDDEYDTVVLGDSSMPDISINAGTIQFESGAYGNFSANSLSLTSVNSLSIGDVGSVAAQYTGNATINFVPSGSNQPFAGYEYITGNFNWSDLGYSAGQELAYQINGGMIKTVEVMGVIGKNLYFTPPSLPDSAGSCQITIGINNPTSNTIIANAFDLTVSGVGSIISAAIASGSGSPSISAQSNNGAITLGYWNDGYVNQTVNVGTIDAGEAPMDLYFWTLMGDPTYNRWGVYSNPDTCIEGSSINVITSGGDVNLNTKGSVDGQSLPLSVFNFNTGWENNSGGNYANIEAVWGDISIQDSSAAGLIIKDAWIELMGQGATVTNNSVQYNSEPFNTSSASFVPALHEGDPYGNLTVSSTGPVYLNTISAVGEVLINAPAILKGDNQQATITAQEIILEATGFSAYQGQVTFAKGIGGKGDTLSLPANQFWRTFGFDVNQVILISGAISSGNNGTFTVANVSGNVLTLSQTGKVTDGTDNSITIGNGVIGSSDAPVSLTGIPVFSAMSSNGSIFLNSGSQLNNLAKKVNAGGLNGVFNNASVQSGAQFLSVSDITASGAAIVNNNAGSIIDANSLLGSDFSGTISGQQVSLTSPYSLGTSIYPLYVAASEALLLNATATNRGDSSIYIRNTYEQYGYLPAIDVSTCNGDVIIYHNDSLTLNFKNNLLVEYPTSDPNQPAKLGPVINFSNTDSNNGDVIIGSTVYANSINAGYGSNGNPGTGQIVTNSSGVIDGSGGPVLLTAASGVGSSSQPVLLRNATGVLATSDSNDIYLSDASTSTNSLVLSALTSSGDIGVAWNGTIQLTSALPSQSGVVLDSISATGTVSLLANGEGASIVSIDKSTISAGTLLLNAGGGIGSVAAPLQVNSPAGLTLNASANNGVYINTSSSVAVGGLAVVSGELSLSAIGDLALAGNLSGGSHISLTATGGTVTQSAGIIGGAGLGNLVIAANSIGSPTDFIQTNVAAITAISNDGGIYISNSNAGPLTLSAAAVGTADGPNANTISIYNAGEIHLQQQSNSLTQLATPLPVAIFSPGGLVNLVAGATMSGDGGIVTGSGNASITSDSDAATAIAAINPYGKVSAVTLTSGGAGYTAPPQVTFSGGGGTGATATATMMSLNGFNNGSGWTASTQDIFTPTVTDDVLTLTQTGAGGNTVNAFWLNETIETNQPFEVSYIWQGTANEPGGVAFVIQNCPQGLNAFGLPGTGQGYSGITNSLSFELDATNNLIAVGTGGNPGSYSGPGSIELGGGNPIQITLSYDPVALAMTLTIADTVTGDIFTGKSTDIDLARIVGGNSAYMGFTSPTGGATATQTVSEFSYSAYDTSVILSGFNNGSGWYAIQDDVRSGPTVFNNVLAITTEPYTLSTNSYWYGADLNINQSFAVSFTYQGTPGGADGMAFVIQNDPQGLSAIGFGQSGLGYRGIRNSLAFGLFELSNQGIFVGTGGNTPPCQVTGEVDLGSGHPIAINLSYNHATQTLSQLLTDTVTGQEFSRITPGINLPQIVGADSATFGFTGSTDNPLSSTQTISNFSYAVYNEIDPLGFNGNGAGWTPVVNAYAPAVSGDVLQLTKAGVNNTANAFWHDQAIALDQPFQVSFSWQGTADGADGVAFVIQNSPEGVDAVGAYGDGQGYGGITNSLAFEIGQFNNEGIALGMGGNIGSYINLPDTPVNSGHSFSISLAYDPARQTLSQNLTDMSTFKEFTRVTTGVNLAQIVDGTSAYIGFTGSTSATTATQTVWNFIYTPSDVSGFTITSAGKGYTSPPVVTIAPPGDDIYTGGYSLNGTTNVNSGSPAYLQSLVIISDTQEIPPPGPVSLPTPALITWDDLTSAVYEAQLKNQTNIPIANGIETLDFATRTVTITAAAITIDSLGQSGNAGTATIPGGWSLILETTGSGTGNSIVFLNPQDTIETTGSGTIVIEADSLASIGNLMTAGGDISIQAGGNIAIGMLAAGQSGSLGAVQVTSSEGVILPTNGSTPNLTGNLVTLNQGGQLNSSSENAALAQINVAGVIAAANAAYASAVAVEASAGAEAGANLALVNSLANSLAKLQASVTTAKQAYQIASSQTTSASSAVRKQYQQLIKDLQHYESVNSLQSQALNISAYSGLLASIGSLSASLLEDIPVVKDIGNTIAFLALSVASSAQVDVSIIQGYLGTAISDVLSDAQQLVTLQYQLTLDQGFANQAFATWQSSQTALTALQVAYSVAQHAYRSSQQDYANAQLNTVAVQAQGATNSATAVANVVFASPAQPISIHGSLPATVSNSNPLNGALDITSNISANTPLCLQAGTGANPSHMGDNLRVTSGVTVQSSGSTVSLTAGNDILLEQGSAIISPANQLTITGNTNGNPAGATITLAGTVSATSVLVGVDPSATGNGIFNITPSLTAPIMVDGGSSSSGGNTLNFNAWGRSVIISGNIITAGNLLPVTFLNIQYVNIINSANKSLTLSGSRNQANTMSLVGNSQRAGIATLNGTTFSFSDMASFSYLAGVGDTIAVTPYTNTVPPFTNTDWLPWNLSVSVAGAANSPASMTYYSPDPYSDVFSTGNYLGYLINPGVAKINFANVNEVAIVHQNQKAVASLPFMTLTVPNATYTGNAYSATATINNGATPEITYYKGTLVGPRYKLTNPPVDSGVYTVVAAYPGDQNWVGETVSAIMTISQAGQVMSSPLTFNQVSIVPGKKIVLGSKGGKSGNPVIYTLDPRSTPNAATISGNILTLFHPGTVIINSNQAGNSNFAPAAQVRHVLNVNPGAANKLAFTSSAIPGNILASAGATLPTIAVEIQDKYGNVVKTSSANVSISASIGSFANGSTTTVKAVNGVAVFSNLILTKAGVTTLTASSNRLSRGKSGVTIVPNAASRIVVNSPVGKSFTAGQLLPAVQGRIEDRYGNVVTSGASSSATVTIAASVGSFAAGSTTTVQAAMGVFRFSNLTLNKAGTSILSASADSMNGSSRSFRISPAAISHAVIVSAPTLGQAGLKLPALVANLVDRFGNLATYSSETIKVAASGGGFAVGSTTSIAAVKGVVTFSNLIMKQAGETNLAILKGTNRLVTTDLIGVHPAAATNVQVTIQPATANTPRGLLLSWMAGTGAVTYKVFRGTNSGEPEVVPLNPVPIQSTSFIDYGVVRGMTYFYTVVAYDGLGTYQSSLNREVSITA